MARFADLESCQWPCFNSRCWNPDTETGDAFTTDESTEKSWWSPPVLWLPGLLYMPKFEVLVVLLAPILVSFTPCKVKVTIFFIAQARATLVRHSNNAGYINWYPFNMG